MSDDDDTSDEDYIPSDDNTSDDDDMSDDDVSDGGDDLDTSEEEPLAEVLARRLRITTPGSTTRAASPVPSGPDPSATPPLVQPRRRAFNATVEDVSESEEEPIVTMLARRREAAVPVLPAVNHKPPQVPTPATLPTTVPPPSDTPGETPPKLSRSQKKKMKRERAPPNEKGNAAKRQRAQQKTKRKKAKREAKHIAEEIELVQNYRPSKKSAEKVSNPRRIQINIDPRTLPAAKGGYVGAGKVHVPGGPQKSQKLEDFKMLEVVTWNGE